MNKTSLESIRSAARFLRTPTAQQARGYLAPALETALKILDAFADDKPHDYDEIAEMTGFNNQTVRQVIRALEDGGYGFTESPSKGWKPTSNGGRPVKAKQLKGKAK